MDSNILWLHLPMLAEMLYENPSVMFSNDLRNWVAGGVANPLVPPPDGACFSRGPANCDNCFVFDSLAGRFYVYYTVIGKDKRRKLVRLASDDCIHWNSTEVLGDMDVFSPSIIYDVEENSFYMWAGQDYQMNLYRSQDGRKWEFMAKCNMQQSYCGKNFQVWHLTVLKVEKDYWAFVVMNPAGTLQGQPPTHIFFFRSKNRVNWAGYNGPILSPSSVGWDSECIYRLGALVKNQKLFVIYSGYKVKHNLLLRKKVIWGFGYAEVDVSALVGREMKSNNVIT